MRIRRRIASFLLALAIATLAMSGCGGRAPVVSQSIDDATMSTRVKTALLNEPDIAVTKIDVDTAQGVVTLTGSVRSKEEEDRAIATARRVSGVRDVKSALKIAPQ